MSRKRKNNQTSLSIDLYEDSFHKNGDIKILIDESENFTRQEEGYEDMCKMFSVIYFKLKNKNTKKKNQVKVSNNMLKNIYQLLQKISEYSEKEIKECIDHKDDVSSFTIQLPTPTKKKNKKSPTKIKNERKC